MSTPMMKCGHAGQAHKVLSDGTRIPCCPICSEPDCSTVVETPNLEGRTARCTYYGKYVRGRVCESERPSSLNLAFFHHKPGNEHDEFYCGCYGWD